jgi:hypothetical protein
MMSDYENPHDDDSPRFEPWLATIVSSFLPVAAAFYLPKDLSALLLTATVVLFAAGLIMLRVQTARRARERNRLEDR